MYRIKNGGYIMYKSRKITDETLTDEIAEELLKQRGMDRSIIAEKPAKDSKKADESGSGKK